MHEGMNKWTWPICRGGAANKKYTLSAFFESAKNHMNQIRMTEVITNQMKSVCFQDLINIHYNSLTLTYQFTLITKFNTEFYKIGIHLY